MRVESEIMEEFNKDLRRELRELKEKWDKMLRDWMRD